MSEKTFMRREVEEIPAATRRFLAGNAEQLKAAGKALRDKDPVAIATIARGSSDHASSFIKYAIELTAGVPVASVGPSVMSIYGKELKFKQFATIAISQSGKSPDIVALAKSAKASGALSFALTNTANSPLAATSDFTIDLRAGPEKSVPATKSFVSSIVAGLSLLGHWVEDAELLAAVARLPDVFEEALNADWSPLGAALDGRSSLYVLGRGPSLAIAGEVALKFKEICGLHAEAYSSAEVIHGPVAIVDEGYPVIAFAARDAAEQSVVDVADTLAGRRAAAFVTSNAAKAAKVLPHVQTGHALTDALAPVVSFYSFVEALAAQRGLNPDTPRNLKKVTETV